jgi:hypothetical protein
MRMPVCEMSRRCSFAWLICVALLTPQTAASQQVECTGVRPLPGSASQYKARGNRCEGLYETDVGGLSIDLVSFTLRPIDFDLRTTTQLEVSAPGEQNRVIHIRAVAKPPRTYYRMDATINAGAVLTWPVSEVLLPERLTADRVGILGWKDGDGSEVFVPLLVVARGAAPKSGQPTVWIRPSFDTQTVKWRSSMSSGRTCARFGEWKDAAGAVSAGDSLSISLAEPRGSTCVEIAASSTASNDWATLKFRVDLPR